MMVLMISIGYISNQRLKAFPIGNPNYFPELFIELFLYTNCLAHELYWPIDSNIYLWVCHVLNEISIVEAESQIR